MATQSLNRLRRKLEAMELEHLRSYAAELEERLEQAEARAVQAEADAERAWESVSFWQRNHELMQDAAMDAEFSTHRAIGITKTGELLVVDTLQTEGMAQ